MSNGKKTGKQGKGKVKKTDENEQSKDKKYMGQGVIKMLTKNRKFIIDKIIVPIGVAILLCIFLFFLNKYLNPPPPDFFISVNPIQGTINKGGVLTTTITVESDNGYEHEVILLQNDVLSGVKVTFDHLSRELRPPYKSNVNISVGSDVQVGKYDIKITGRGGDGKEQTCTYRFEVTPDIQYEKNTPPFIVIDSMESPVGWAKYTDDKGSSINVTTISGRTDNALEITYDLKEGGYVIISKNIEDLNDSEVLSEIQGIRFFYKGEGKQNTIGLKLEYGDDDKTTFGDLWNRKTVSDNWEPSLEVQYNSIKCLSPKYKCENRPYGPHVNEFNQTKVRKIEFAISNKPSDGDEQGSGKVIIDDVQGIVS